MNWRQEKANQALIEAAHFGDINRIMAALNKGANVNTHAGNGWCALTYAAVHGTAEIVRCLLAAGADANANLGPHRWYALDHAAMRGHVEVVRILLAAGANVHAMDDRALLLAASEDRVVVSRLLLAAGADPLVAWANVSRSERQGMVATLEACADALTPDQRNALAAKSRRLASLRSAPRVCRVHQGLQR